MDKTLHMTEEGSHTIYAKNFEATYHSSHGAIQETRTVFIEAGFLHLSQMGYHTIDILEIGFGTGLNAFMTYLETLKFPINVQYTAFEAYPIDKALAAQLNYPTLLATEAHQDSFIELHNHPNEPTTLKTTHNTDFSFLLKVALFEDIEYSEQFDLIYFDAFAPSTQAHLWEAPFLKKMYKSLRPEGILVTYCAQGAFKRALKSVGFLVENLPGPKGKREMTRAKKVAVL